MGFIQLGILICIVLLLHVHDAHCRMRNYTPNLSVGFKSSKRIVGLKGGYRSTSATSTSISTSTNKSDSDSDSDSDSSRFLKKKLDIEFARIAIPAFISLVADPLAALVDSMYVGRLAPFEQAGMGIASSAQYSVSKLTNDPLMKTTTSMVAGRQGSELSAAVGTAIFTALTLGLVQSAMFLFLTGPILSFMGVGKDADMRAPALSYLKWRAVGVPAATVLLVSNGIFRGRGDTTTPLYCTSLGNLCNIALDPLLIFGLGMGVDGAGAALAASQWLAAVPLLYQLKKRYPFKIEKGFWKNADRAAKGYMRAGGLILLRTIAKIIAYSLTASAAASLGSVPMAAYSLTFNLGFATSQLCESVSIASQAFLLGMQEKQAQK